MSEKYPLSNPEVHINSQEREKLTHEAEKKHHERSNVEEKKQSKDEIYKQIEVALANKEARKKEEQEAQHHDRPHHYITKSVKRGVYKHTMKNVQTHLKPSERRFSKIVHNETVETLSELGASTVARPNAILGGGIAMVFGGLALLLTARYFGFTIPMSSLIALYVVGFVLLLVVDIIAKPFKKRFLKKN
jgi:cation transport ATPase